MESVLDCMVGDGLTAEAVLAGELARTVGERIGARGGLALREPARAARLLMQLAGRGARVALSPLAPEWWWEALRAEEIEPLWIDALLPDGRDDGLQPVEAVGHQYAPRYADCAAIVRAAPCGGLELDAVADSIERADRPLLIEGCPGSEGIHSTSASRRRRDYALIGLEAHHSPTAAGGALVLVYNRRQERRLRECVVPDGTLLPELNAALALAQVRQLDHLQARRHEISTEYRRAAAVGRHTPLLCALDTLPGFPLLVDDLPAAIAYAESHGVACAAAFADTILARHRNEIETDACPHARRLLKQCALFPLYPLLSVDEREQVCRVLRTLA